MALIPNRGLQGLMLDYEEPLTRPDPTRLEQEKYFNASA